MKKFVILIMLFVLSVSISYTNAEEQCTSLVGIWKGKEDSIWCNFDENGVADCFYNNCSTDPFCDPGELIHITYQNNCLFAGHYWNDSLYSYFTGTINNDDINIAVAHNGPVIEGKLSDFETVTKKYLRLDYAGNRLRYCNWNSDCDLHSAYSVKGKVNR